MFAELDKTERITQKDIDEHNPVFVENMRIDASFFDRYSAFFASIGYIARQVA